MGAAALAVLALSAGCRTEGLAFRADERVEIVEPEARSTVRLPFDLRWDVTDFDPNGKDGSASTDSGYFGVFIDTAPIPPGETLAYLSRDDPECRTPCLDAPYLSQRGVRTTKQTQLRVDTITDNRPVDRPSAKDEHEITIVLLNGRGERIGEAAFMVRFTVDRGQDG